MRFPGAIYHVTHRGVEKRLIFEDDFDRQRYLRRLQQTVENTRVRLYQFCLMPNHVHLVLETPLANVSQFMHRLETAYCIYFNIRHHRSGHLMQGRFGAQLVRGDDYLLRLTRYVHLNPVRTSETRDLPMGIRIDTLLEHKWSSYLGYIGAKSQYSFVDEGPVLALVAGNLAGARRRYRQYVETGLATCDNEMSELLRSGPPFIGEPPTDPGPNALALPKGAKIPQPKHFRQVGSWQAARWVLVVVGALFGVSAESLQRRQYGCAARAVAAWMLCRHAGLSQAAVGNLLGMGGGSAVSHRLRRLEAEVERDPGLASKLAVIDRRLREDSQHCQGLTPERADPT